MEMNDFVQKKCNSGKNIQFMPKRHVKLDLDKTVSLLEKAVVEIETPSLLIFRLDGVQIDLNRSGKTVVKTDNSPTAKNAFSKVLPAISKSVKQ